MRAHLWGGPGGGRCRAAAAALRSQVPPLSRLLRWSPSECERLLVMLIPRLCPVYSVQEILS